MTAALLVAEPEPDDRELLERHLAADGFDVLGATSPPEALDLVERARPDLVLAGEPDLCRRLREGEPGRTWDRAVPVIVLGQDASDPVDRVRAFERGCDDYVTRPFHYDELLARIRAVLRRSARPRRELVVAGELELERLTRCARVRGRRLALGSKEFELLARLAEEPTRVYTKDELLREIWGFRSSVRTRTLDSHASRIRRKIAELTETPYVVNAWGVGYSLMEPE